MDRPWLILPSPLCPFSASVCWRPSFQNLCFNLFYLSRPDCNDGCKVFVLQVNKSFITSPFLKRPQNGFITSSKSEISWFSKFLLQVDFITSQILLQVGFITSKAVLVDHFTKTLKTSLVRCWNLKFWILKT